ncbi:hypothetical protein ACN38_g984 [Penicillium nordicum]|uniref:Uncharacterized protein n=1 Tax=Penicillium nordicum TaxID=229535 RepID=A0A0M8PCD1_9EURO|nr:hypothetical protein ACN38_g984 [Penicillium nordicum]
MAERPATVDAGPPPPLRPGEISPNHARNGHHARNVAFKRWRRERQAAEAMEARRTRIEAEVLREHVDLQVERRMTKILSSAFQGCSTYMVVPVVAVVVVPVMHVGVVSTGPMRVPPTIGPLFLPLMRTLAVPVLNRPPLTEPLEMFLQQSRLPQMLKALSHSTHLPSSLSSIQRQRVPSIIIYEYGLGVRLLHLYITRLAIWTYKKRPQTPIITQTCIPVDVSPMYSCKLNNKIDFVATYGVLDLIYPLFIFSG